MKYMFCGILMIVTLVHLSGQDTLRFHIDKLKNDSLKFQWIGDEINKAWLADPDRTLKLSKLYESLANESSDSIRHAESLNYKGVAAYANGEYDIAADLYLRSLSILEGTSRYQLLGYVLNNLASCYAFRNDNAKSIQYYLQALDVAEKAQDTARLATIIWASSM